MAKRAMPEIDRKRCSLCGDCVTNCPHNAVALVAGVLLIDEARCEYCGDCEDICPEGAVALPFDIILSKPQDAVGG